jgi:hypothetical protein
VSAAAVSLQGVRRLFAACWLGSSVVRNDLGTVGVDHLDDEGCDIGSRQMSARTAARLGWFLFVASVLLLVSALVLNLRRPEFADLAFTTGELVWGLALLLFGWFGALVVSRQPSHPIGWVLCGFGVLGGVGGFASEYAIYGLRSHPGAVPGAAALAWFASWAFALELALLGCRPASGSLGGRDRFEPVTSSL